MWQDIALPADKIIIPGVIDSTSNFVEHPELVADRIVQYARIVGRERVIAGVDCGFGTFAGRVQVDTKIVWMKLAALAEGARLASRQLWCTNAHAAKTGIPCDGGPPDGLLGCCRGSPFQ